MTADQLVQYLAWAVYLLIFATVAVKAVRQPTPARVNMTLFFTDSTLLIALSVAQGFGLIAPGPLYSAFIVSFYFILAYLLLRLADDFTGVPSWVLRSCEGWLALMVLATFYFAFNPPQPGFMPLLSLVFLLVWLACSTVMFARESLRTRGVTRRRMTAVTFGTVFLFLDFGFLGITLFLPQATGLVRIFSDLAGLASAISYFLGFAPPGLLRRAWQEPELRAFLGRAANLPRLPDTRAIIAEMERGAASSLGAPHAMIGLWNAGAQVLHFDMGNDRLEMAPADLPVSGRAFLSQRASFTPDLARNNPLYSDAGTRYGARALLAAPITAGEKRIGVLTVYAPRAPIFAEEDLDLAQLLADQAAVILESRALIDEAARVRAREEVARLKEDFLSAAAHDLKTPLTTLVAQSQLLERRVLRAPDQPADLLSIQKLVKETQRLRLLVMELLDASRAEQGRLVGERETVDLAAIARETCERHTSGRHPCIVEADGPVTGLFDGHRVGQLIENLVENAIKYSPGGGPVRLRVWREGEWCHLTVADRGIGIPVDDLPYVFDRFHRGTNVDDKRFAGMGLGLFICRAIVQQHNGEISVTNQPGGGTMFSVVLPASAPAYVPEIAAKVG